MTVFHGLSDDFWIKENESWKKTIKAFLLNENRDSFCLGVYYAR